MNLLSLMRLLRFSIFTLVIVGLSITHAADNPSPREQPLTTNEVQERAVPPNIEGAIMQGNQLKAAPGYVLEKGANNQLTVRRKAGGTSTINAH